MFPQHWHFVSDKYYTLAGSTQYPTTAVTSRVHNQKPVLLNHHVTLQPFANSRNPKGEGCKNVANRPPKFLALIFHVIRLTFLGAFSCSQLCVPHLSRIQGRECRYGPHGPTAIAVAFALYPSSSSSSRFIRVPLVLVLVSLRFQLPARSRTSPCQWAALEPPTSAFPCTVLLLYTVRLSYSPRVIFPPSRRSVQLQSHAQSFTLSASKPSALPCTLLSIRDRC